MRRELNDSSMSNLEREFERERELELGSNDNYELDDDRQSENPDDFELDDLEVGDNSVENDVDDYAQRFMELARRGFESESEMDDAVNEILNEMERDYFFGGLLKKLKKAGKGLLKKGLKFAKKAVGGLPVFGAIKGLTQLARGNLKGMLGSLAKSALGTFVPGGSVALQGLNSLGFEVTDDQSENSEAWRNFVNVARESFEYLGDNLNENVDNPLEATRLAHNALQAGLKRVPSRSRSLGQRPHRRRIHVRKGEVIIVEGI